MRLIVSAMHRSGINAIGKWLLRQSSLKSKTMTPIWEDWVEDYHEMGHITHMFISQINHPNHSDWLKISNGVENVILTIERESIQRVEELSQELGLLRRKTFEDEYMDIDYSRPKWRHVVIIRTFKNWLASSLEMGSVTVLDIEKYRSYLEWATDTTLYFSGREGFDPNIIVYDKWVKSADYRKEICRILDLRYTNCGFRDVPTNGGGSSFDGLKFNGKAHEMKVLERWKEYEDDEGFQIAIDRYSDIVEMSDRFCE